MYDEVKLRFPQFRPKKPVSLQLYKYPPNVETHVPPFSHGWDRQPSQSICRRSRIHHAFLIFLPIICFILVPNIILNRIKAMSKYFPQCFAWKHYGSNFIYQVGSDFRSYTDWITLEINCICPQNSSEWLWWHSCISEPDSCWALLGVWCFQISVCS